LNEAGEFMRNIRQNLSCAFLYNAAGVLYPVFWSAPPRWRCRR
jgi:cation transport ATPase